MARLIEVEERDLDYIFGQSKPYSLDVYQRDYRWSDEKDYKIVSQLLLDIELRFENNLKVYSKNKKTDLQSIYNDVNVNFKAYFLNTIMLNEQGGDIFIVDGQQRLTTLLLLFIKLYHLGLNNNTNGMNIPKLIGEKIFEEDKAGRKHFKISNIDRNDIIRKIFEDEKISPNDIVNITQYNLRENYHVISKYLDKYFFSKEGNFDSLKYNYYVYNLTEKVLIIEQVIKHKEDVAMIFETANDRGKELESHEVLKGMLLGVLNTENKEKCNIIWNEALRTFFQIDGNYKNVDEFFRTYFRAKYADNQNQYQSFAGKYHRSLLSNDKIINDLDRNDPPQINNFINHEFVYFYKVYLQISKIAKEESNIFIASNSVNDRGQQFLLILSALEYNDKNKDEKISLVAKKIDQFYSMSKLLGIYNSNDQQTETYELNKVIRNKTIKEIEIEFDKIILKYFNNKGIQCKDFKEIFQYRYFQFAKNDGFFTKYLFTRVDMYLANLLNENSFAKQENLYFITHSGTKPATGFHIEHIFSNNELIMEQFKDENEEFDQKLFNDERNRLGALILLKGNENIRTSNWIYKKKFISYQNSGFIWNRILTNSINPASLNNCEDSIKNSFKGYLPNEDGLLVRDAIEERQYLLFQIIQKIYAD